MSDDRATPAVEDLLDKYGDAVTTLHRIYLEAQMYDMDKELGKQNVHGFAGWMRSVMPDIKHELCMRHKVEL